MTAPGLKVTAERRAGGAMYGVVTVGGGRVELDAAGLREHAARALAVADLLVDDDRWHPSWCRRSHSARQAHESTPVVLPGTALAATLPGEDRPLHVLLYQGSDRGPTLVMVEAYDPAVMGTQPAEVLTMPLDVGSALATTLLRLIDDAARDLGDPR